MFLIESRLSNSYCDSKEKLLNVTFVLCYPNTLYYIGSETEVIVDL